ncbi:MAG: type II secretion system GspH family protein, partial [Muribaculaceae bacterium]|nr:type II secretion system GspH family protein [Muribaculaceae bacterium]
AKAAFTLAEVLITLGIIGVVAAMTIPNLIANTTAHKYRNQFKKTVSTLSQAARMSQAQYGFDYAGITQTCGSNAASEHPDSVMSICAIFNGSITGATYYKTLTDIPVKKNNSISSYSFESPAITSSSGTAGNMRAYILSDGTIVAFASQLGSKAQCSLPVGEVMRDVFQTASFTFMADCYGFIDVNGAALPNKEVSCSSGLNTLTSNTCVVKNDAKHMTDIFPIRFHDGVVEPSTAAARYVLRTTK